MTFTTKDRLLVVGSVIALAAAAPGLAAAQAQSALSSLESSLDSQSSFFRKRNVSVRERPHPGYEALGIRSGSFFFFPRLTLGAEYNDNVYASSTDEIDSVVLRAQPEVLVNSNWSRHYLGGYARAGYTNFTDVSSENFTDWDVGTNGRIDVVRGTYLSGGLAYGQLTEPRTAVGTPVASVDPIEYDHARGSLGFSREVSRLRLSARFGWDDFDYEDGRTATGVILDQDFRDRSVYAWSGRADYALSPDTALFASVGYSKHDYDLRPPLVGLIRDSDGYEIMTGANFELTSLIRGELGVGYLKHSFDDPASGDVDGLAARGELEWFPTQLTTVGVNAARGFQDFGVFGTPGSISTTAGARVDHELLRNLILSGALNYAHDNYRRIDRRDDRYEAVLSATYLMNRRVGITTSYGYVQQISAGAASGVDFSVNRIGASVTLQY